MSFLWVPRLATFLLWIFVILGVGFWLTEMGNLVMEQQQVQSKRADALALDEDKTLTQQVTLALGAKAAPLTETAQLQALQGRFRLLGVLAVGSTKGAALISVDGKPAKHYRVDAEIETGLQLKSVSQKTAVLSLFTLELQRPNTAY